MSGSGVGPRVRSGPRNGWKRGWRVGWGGRMAAEVAGGVGAEQPDEGLGNDAAADGTEGEAVGGDFRLGQDVVPQGGAGGEGGVDSTDVSEVGWGKRILPHGGRDGLAGGQAPGELAEQVPLRQNRGSGLGVRGDSGNRQGEHDRGDGGVDLLVVLHLPVTEVEESLPADVPAWRG